MKPLNIYQDIASSPEPKAAGDDSADPLSIPALPAGAAVSSRAAASAAPFRTRSPVPWRAGFGRPVLLVR